MFESTIVCGQIILGKQGENLAKKFSFNDVRIWKEIFGEGRCELLHQRNGDSVPYPVSLVIEDDVPYWYVSEVDTFFAGEGKCEIRYIINDTVVKSSIYTTYVQEALGEGSEEPPEPQKAWVDEVLDAANHVETVFNEITNISSVDNTKAFRIIDYHIDDKGFYYYLDAGNSASEHYENILKIISESADGVLYTVKNGEYASAYGKILGAELNENIIKITVDKLYVGGSVNSLPGTVLVYENKTTEGAFTNHKDTFWSVCGDVSKYKSLRFKARTSDVPYLAFSFMKKDGTWVHNAGNKDALIKLNQGTQFEEYYLDLTSFPEWNGEIEYIHINQRTPDWQSGYKGTVEFAEITLDEQPIYSWDFEDFNSQRWKISDWSAADGVTLTYVNGEMKYSQSKASGGRAIAIWDKSFIANDYKALKIRVKSPDSWVKGLNLDVRGTLSNGAGNIWYNSIRNITAEYQDFTINFADSDNWKDSIISRLSFLLVDAKGEDTTGIVVIDSIELIPNDNITYDAYTWDFETPETCLWESPNRATSKVTYEYIAPSLGFSIQNRETDGTDASLFLCGYRDIGVIDIKLNTFNYGDNNYCCAKNSTTVGENLKAGENVRLFGENIDARNAKDSSSTGRNNIIEGFVKNIFQHGVGLVSSYSNQIQFGRYNENKERNVLEIGIGDNSLDRKNMFEIDKDGNMYLNGKQVILNNEE